MADFGLPYAGEIIADKGIQRFVPEGKKSDSGWYTLFSDGLPAGKFGDWSTGESKTWHHKNGGGERLSKEELAACQKRWKAAEEQRRRDEIDRWARSATRASEIISKCSPATDLHPYLEAKGVPASAELLVDESNRLLLPLKDATGKLWSYQTIDFLGEKLFMPGGKVKGCFFQLGKPSEGPLIVCEGYATGATIRKATGWPVFCAMNCGNLEDVAVALRAAHPEKTMVIAADDDRFTKSGNPGMEKASEAAKSCNAVVAVPNFPDNSKGTDFNDLQCECGEGVVRGVFHSLLGIGMGKRIEIDDLLSFVPKEDKDSIIGNRYLCRGGSCVIVAQTSAGKSSLGMQMAIMFALGLPFHGMRPRKPLRSLIVQAENDIGDTAEMFQGVLLGLGLVSESTPEDNNALIKVLKKNLIIIRDQTHIGSGFSEYANKLVELHKPDLFWIDPMLSFFGDDINDQKAMSQFLRAELNPISERTGIIWMLLHHTGKPAKDASKTQKSWSSRDFSYMGLGSSELSNWARAIICLTATGEDEFRMIFAKRGWRAGVVDEKGHPTTELHLAYSSDHICWKSIPKPQEGDQLDNTLFSFAKTLVGESLSASEIVHRAADALQRGERTVWKLWDSGSGPLGRLFKSDGLNRFTPLSTTPARSSVKDD